MAVHMSPASFGSASVEVKPWLLGLSILMLQVEVPRMTASVRVSLGSPRGSDRRGRGGWAVRGGKAHPSPLAGPRDPIPRVEVRGGLARPAVFVGVFGSSATQLQDWWQRLAWGGVLRGFLVVTVVKVLEAPAPIRVSAGSSRGPGRACSGIPLPVRGTG